MIIRKATFSFVLKAIENSKVLKERSYAIIADEAHSSQTGSTAKKLKEVLMVDEKEIEEYDGEDLLDATVAKVLI